MKRKIIFLLFIVTCLSINAIEFEQSEPYYTYSSAITGSLKIAPDPQSELRSGTTTNIFQIIYEGDESEWGVVEREALNYAVKLWESILWKVEGIKIKVQFEPLSEDILAATTIRYASGSEINDTYPLLYSVNSSAYYPMTLARRLSPDLDNSDEDVIISFNNNKNLWYFGTDRNAPSSKYDFVTAVLRELAKSFGFYSNISKNARGAVLSKPFAASLFCVYDYEIFNANKALVSIPFNSSEVGDFAQRVGAHNNKDVYFKIYDADNNAYDLKLYAPNTFENYTSLMYFDEDAYLNQESALMAPKQRKGEAIHKIGNNVLGVLRQIGWFDDSQAVGMYTDPSVWIYSAAPEGSLLQFNRNYSFSIHSDNETIVMDSRWKLEVLKTDGTFVTIIPEQTSDSFTLNLNANSIPNGNWARNQSGMIKARVLVTGEILNNGFRDYILDYDLLIPAKPAKPELKVRSIVDRMEDWETDVVLEFSSFQEVTTYVFSQQEKGSHFILSQNLAGNVNTYNLEGLYMDFGYIFKVRAKNQYGESEDAILEIGGDPNYYLGSGAAALSSPRLPVTMHGISWSGSDELILNFHTSDGSLSGVEVKDVEIINLTNPALRKHERYYNNGSSINMGDMPAGFYTVKAVDGNNQVYISKFFK